MSTSCTTQKAKRKNISLEVKKKVIELKDQGKGNTEVGRLLGLGESSVRAILKNRLQIEKTCDSYGSSALDSRSYSFAAAKEIVKTERFLYLWICRKESEGVELDKKAIMEQAKVFYSAICKKNNVTPNGFKASTGWLYRFMQRKKIRNLNLTGEVHSADEVAANEFPSILKGIIEDPNASVLQVQRAADAVADAVREARLVPGFGDVPEDELLEIHREGESLTVEEIMTTAAVEDALQQEPRIRPAAADDDAGSTELSLGALSTILAGIDSLKSIIAENETCQIRKMEMTQAITRNLRFYSDLHIKKQNARKQALITKFVTPNAPVRQSVPGSSRESTPALATVQDLFEDDHEMEEFEGFLNET